MKPLDNKLITAPCGFHGGRSHKIVLRDFHWFDHTLGKIIVPKGFIFDGGSLPRFTWSITGVTPFSNLIIDAAVVHDYLYYGLNYLNEDGDLVAITREQADKVFLRIMQKQKLLGRLRRGLFYYSVVAFGGRHSAKCKNSDNIKYNPDLADVILRQVR